MAGRSAGLLRSADLKGHRVGGRLGAVPFADVERRAFFRHAGAQGEQLAVDAGGDPFAGLGESAGQCRGLAAGGVQRGAVCLPQGERDRAPNRRGTGHDGQHFG